MKNTFAVLLLTAALFYGCRSEKIVINALAYGSITSNEGRSWERLVSEFEDANRNIHIEYELLSDEAYRKNVKTRIAGGNIPDLAFTGASSYLMKPWQDAGLLYDHSDVINSEIYDTALIPDMDSTVPGKQIYEIPYGTSNLNTVLFMNKKLVSKLGFDTPESYEDIKAMAAKAKANGLYVATLNGADGWAWSSCLMSMLIARMSGDMHWVSGTVAGKKSFTDKAMINALSFLKQMVDDGVISQDLIFVDYGNNISNYSEGKALFMIQRQWAAGEISDSEVADNTLMMVWPAFPGEISSAAGCVAATVQTGYGIINSPKVRRSNKTVEAILSFLDFFYAEEEATRRLKDSGIVAPVLKDYAVPQDFPLIIKARVSLARSVQKECEVIEDYLEGPANDALNKGMQEIVIGTRTPQEVAELVQALLDEQLLKEQPKEQTE